MGYIPIETSAATSDSSEEEGLNTWEYGCLDRDLWCEGQRR